MIEENIKFNIDKKSSNKIFVSIACFMDNDILNTINDCLEKAEYPNNIVFGICFQHDPDDDYLKIYDNNPQFRIHKMHWNQARGPTYARYFCTQLLKDEEYFLQIDCHTRFFDKWDTLAKNCLKECNDEKAILTAFPIGIKNMSKALSSPLNKSTQTFHSLSMDSIKLGSMCCNSNVPVKTYYLSAAFLFGKSKFIYEVPHDPSILYAYQAIEQQFYAVRLFTYGWNLYMPSKHILATTYDKTPHFDAKNNRVNAPSNFNRGKLSWQRVLYYYGLKTLDEISDDVKKDINLYGLGKERTLKEFFKILNEEDCIEKIKAGQIYNKGKWIKYTYECENQVFDSIIRNNDSFMKISSNENKTVDFKWNINPKTTNNKFQHYPQQYVTFIDNKKTFFSLLCNNNIKEGIPKTYFDVNKINNTLSSTSQNNKISLTIAESKNYFLKYAGNNGGKQVHIYNNIQDIKHHLKNDNRPYIIQEEVDDMLLIDNKKFILRNWIVIVDNKFYLSTNGCCIIHEFEYDKNILDRKAHIDHDIAKIGYEFYNRTIFYEKSFKKVIILLQHICSLIKKNLQFQNNYFQVLGLDIIFNNDLNPYIIEINSWPNMSVPYGNYKLILQEFFTNFFNDVVIKKLSNEPITETDYFLELKTENCDTNNFKIKKPEIIIPDSIASIPIVLILDKLKSIGINVIESLNSFNLEFSTFNQELFNTEMYNKMISDKIINIDRYKLRNEQVSLWNSHLILWNQMIQENIPKLLILEDKCNFVEDFQEKYNRVLEETNYLKYDILYLGYSGTNVVLDKDLHLLSNGCPRCTHSYILTLSGAKKLVEKLKTIDYPFDEIMGAMFNKGELIGYRTSQLLTYQDFQKKK